MNNKIRDFVGAAKGTVGEMLCEDAVPALFTEMLKGTVVESATGFLTAASPRIGGFMIAYQQKRWERNWECYIMQIVERQAEINKRLDELDDTKKNAVKQQFFPLVSDYVQNEKQKEKIELIVNGFVNIASGINNQEDTVIMFYDTLEQLSMLELKVFGTYTPATLSQGSAVTIYDVMVEYDIDQSQVALIKEKLARLGLLESKNDIDMDNNNKEVFKYIQAVVKGKKVKEPKLKTINRSESYKITTYGRRFLEFFM